MSWDLTAFKRPSAPLQRARDPLGTVEEIRRLFEQDSRFDFDFHYCCWIGGNGFEIEINIGSSDSDDADILDHLAIEVRGGGDPIPLLCELAQKFDWILEDLATGELLDCTVPSDTGWKTFQAAKEEGEAVARDLLDKKR